MTPIAVVLPSRARPELGVREADLDDLQRLLARERAWLAATLGRPVRLTRTDPGRGPRMLLGPRAANPWLARQPAPTDATPRVRRRDADLLLAEAPDLPSVWTTLSLLAVLQRRGSVEEAAVPVADPEQAVARVAEEVAQAPLALAGTRDWAARSRHLRPDAAGMPSLAALQRWVAALEDLHTAVRPTTPTWQPPYEARVEPTGVARLHAVPWSTAGWEAGARPGDRLLAPDATGMRARVGAAPHARGLHAGRALLATPLGQRCQLTAVRADGTRVSWAEARDDAPPRPEVRWGRRGRIGVLVLAGWSRGSATADDLDLALAELADAEGLVVDLRGNVGGELLAAQDARDRFVPPGTPCGTLRSVEGGGERLSSPVPVTAWPSPRRRWRGPVRVLVDPLTASASEDFLLGLAGLAGVEVLGEPTAGALGRPRRVALLPGADLSVSTALAADRRGRVVEGRGIGVDRALRTAPATRAGPTRQPPADPALEVAVGASW